MSAELRTDIYVPVGLALVGTSTKLAQDCMRLYQFWDSLRNAPDDVKVIKNDLMLLTNVLGDISQQKDLSPAVRLTLDSCQEKVKVSWIRPKSVPCSHC
jgi:hypothetical protein